MGINSIISLYDRLCNDGKHPLNGITIHGSVFTVKPFIEVNFDTMAVEGGVTLDILKTMANYYNFNYTVRYSHNWFEFHADGSITGALGEVIIQYFHNFVLE